MPKMVTDISSWDQTEATIYVWPVPSEWTSIIVENITTNEVFLVPGGVSYIRTIDNQHNEYRLIWEDYLWGYVHVERDVWGMFEIVITQSEPDYTLYPAAVALMNTYYPEDPFVDPFPGYVQVCDALRMAVYDGRGNLTDVAEVCGPFFVK